MSLRMTCLSSSSGAADLSRMRRWRAAVRDAARARSPVTATAVASLLIAIYYRWHPSLAANPIYEPLWADFSFFTSQFDGFHLYPRFKSAPLS